MLKEMECVTMKNQMQPPQSPGGGLIIGVSSFLYLLLASVLYAAELPALVLEEGANRVGLTPGQPGERRSHRGHRFY